MADAVTSQTLSDGDRIAVMKFTNISDGSGEASVEKVDVASLATNMHGETPARVHIEQIWYDIGGMRVALEWNATSNVVAAVLGGSAAAGNVQGHMDFRSFGGLKNNAGQAFTDFTKLHFCHSVADTDYISVLPITVAASTNYHLKIKFDSDRKMSIFVDGEQYNITSTAGSTGGTAVTKGTGKSGAMTDNIDFIPYIGIENCDAAAAVLNVQYEAISRLIFE